MIDKHLALCALCSFFAASFCAAANASETQAPFLPEYFNALAATMHGQSTPSDVDAVLEFYADDIVYEHPAAGIRLAGKDAQRQGMTAFLDSYGGDPEDTKIEILDYLKGPKMVALRISSTFQLKNEGAAEIVSREQTRVVEFREGKISRIIDYW